MPLDSVESAAAKRQRLADQRLQEQPAANELHTAAHTHHPSYHSKTDFQRTSGNTANQNGPAGLPLTHRPSECREHQTKESSRQPRQGDCDQQLSQHRKKKSKKHKDKERERSKDKKVSEWSQTSPELKQKQHKLDGEPTFIGQKLLQIVRLC